MAWLNGPNLIISPDEAPRGHGGPWENSTTHKVYMLIDLLSAGTFGLYRSDSVQGLPSPWTLVHNFAADGYSKTATWFFDRATGILYSYMLKSDGSCTLATFDTNTETFMAVTTVTSGSNPPVGLLPAMNIHPCPDGSILLVGDDSAGDGMCLYRFRDGVWEDKVVAAPSGCWPRELRVDSEGGAHVLYHTKVHYYDPDEFRVVRVKADNTVEYDVTVANCAPGNNYYERDYSAMELTATDYIVSMPDGKVYTALRATAGPFAYAGAGVGSNNTFKRNSVCLADDGEAYVVWCYQDVVWDSELDADVVNADEMRAAHYSGSGVWDAAVVGVNFLEHPPVFPEGLDPIPPGTGQYSHQLWLTRAVSNGFGVVCDFLLNNGEVTCTIFYTNFNVEASTAPTLDCNNPPNGEVGAAYNHQLIISGGTPPFTMSLVSGDLPDGLSMDNSGNITGTPTKAGTFSFTAKVQDSSGG